MRSSKIIYSFKKAVIALIYLIGHPRYLKRYFKDNFLHKRTEAPIKITPLFSLRCSSPIDLGMPWFAYSAIDFLESFLKKQMKVFEWCTGGSSVFFAKRCESVYSIENSKQWYCFIQSKLSKLG